MTAATRGSRGAREDERWMRRCIELALRAEGKTSPNPMVGAVLVDKRGRMIAEGYHRGAGKPHAEAEALRRAGTRARGATLYCSLEPCNHQGRTPPCAPAVHAAGVARVVYGCDDPYPRHGGGRWLRARGVPVQSGVLRSECEELVRFFMCWAQTRRSYLVAKLASSLDGRTATRTGESQWITSAEARRDGRSWRSRLDAILVGVGTVVADDPQLTSRERGGRDPVRVVVDSALRTPVGARLLPVRSGGSKARVIIATTARAAPARERRLVAAGAEVWRLPAARGRVKLPALLERLGEAGVLSVLCEGGAELHGALFAAGLVDEVALYLAPRWIGQAARLADAATLQFAGDAVRIGPDLFVSARRLT